MTKSTKISYVLIALLLLIVCVMHLATPFITVLFSYFALRKLRFGRRGKTLAVVLFSSWWPHSAPGPSSS
jgi:hypothetical protein